MGEATHPCNPQPGRRRLLHRGQHPWERREQDRHYSHERRRTRPRKGGQFHRKLPGGYFRVPGTHGGVADASAVERREKQLHTISYGETQTAVTRGIPVPLQRLAVKEYCTPRNIKYAFEHIELEGMLHYPTLLGLITQDRPDEIILFSVFSLPEDTDDRCTILDAALANSPQDFSSPVITTRDLATVDA